MADATPEPRVSDDAIDTIRDVADLLQHQPGRFEKQFWALHEAANGVEHFIEQQEATIASKAEALAAKEAEIERLAEIVAAADKGSPIYDAVERILDEKSAWIARPSAEVTRAIAMAAGIAWSTASKDAAGELFDRATAAEAALKAAREALGEIEKLREYDTAVVDRALDAFYQSQNINWRGAADAYGDPESIGALRDDMRHAILAALTKES